jgi:hypothetical protein
MSGVFQNIGPPSPLQPGECVPLVQGEDTLAGWRGGWGVNILEDVRHSSVLYICKYFVLSTLFGYAQVRAAVLLHGHADGQLQSEETLSRPAAPGGRRAHARGRAQGQLIASSLLHCKENRIYVFLFWELRGLSPNFHIHVYVSDFYILRIGPHISCSNIGRLIMEIYKSLADI